MLPHVPACASRTVLIRLAMYGAGFIVSNFLEDLLNLNLNLGFAPVPKNKCLSAV